MMMTLKVNGRAHTVDVDPATPLLYVLSDDLELNGPKFGCGMAQCGACTVISNGRAIRSCVTPVETVANAEITTLDGLGTPEQPHPIQTGVHRRAGRSVRLLSQRRRPDRESVSRSESAGDRTADPAGDVGRAVPLLHAHADDSRHLQIRAGAAGRDQGARTEPEPPRQDASESGRNA